MKVAIVGSRNFRSEELVRDFIRDLDPIAVAEVVSGGARGVDTWAAEEARKLKIPVRTFQPDWDKWGKRAGFLRNTEIVEYSDQVFAFWDGLSRGTLDSITKAAKAKKLRGIYFR